MSKTKNFSFSDFMSFSESLVDSLDAVATKITEVTNQIETLETVLEGDNTEGAAEAPEVSAEENVAEEPAADTPVEESVATEETVEETPAAEDTAVTEEVATEEPVAEDVPADESAPEEVTEEADSTVSEEDNDSAAIDAMSTGDENFSDKFMVVGLKNRPWGNRVIAAKDFSEKEHNKLIPTLFSTQAQAQRALTSYNVNGPANFSIRYNHVNQILGMNNTENKSESKVINASEKPQTRYDQVKSIFGMN